MSLPIAEPAYVTLVGKPIPSTDGPSYLITLLAFIYAHFTVR